MRGSVGFSPRKGDGKKTWFYRFRNPRAGLVGEKPWINVSKDPDTGQPIASEDRAWALCAADLARRSSPRYVQPTRQPLAEYLERWLRETAHRRQAGSSYHHASTIRAVIAPELGDIPLHALDALTLQGFYRALSDDGYAPRTVHRVHAILGRALKDAVAWRLLPDNPASGMVLPAVGGERRPVWTAAQVQTFLAHGQNAPLYPLWCFLIDSWCRIGEAQVVTWEDVDLEASVVAISKTRSRARDGTRIVAARTKTEAGHRHLHLMPETIAVLRRHKRAQLERRLALGPRWHAGGIVFDRHDGGVLAQNVIGPRLAAACVAAGVPVLTAHEIRHTGPTLAAAAGMPLKAISDRLGHRSISITADLYAHPTAEADQALAAGFRRLLVGDDV